jgi:predicted signal transduction protein with EAL and GGDEF domain
VLLSDTKPREALELTVRISRALSVRAPCSVGLACFPIDGGALEDLMRQADGRLYAYRHGRRGRGAGASVLMR